MSPYHSKNAKIKDDDFCQVDQSTTFVTLLRQLSSRIKFDCEVTLEMISESIFMFKVHHDSHKFR